MHNLEKITQDKIENKFMERDLMKKLIIFCISIIIFSAGIILGAGLNSIGIEKQVALEKTKIDSIQDVVIKNVQTDSIEGGDKIENEKIEQVIAVETKISPYATLIIEKFFKTCGHSTVETMEIPKELVNMTEEELQRKYEKWQIKKFDEKEIYLYREIDANCDAHFVIKEDEGKVAVFAEIANNNMQKRQVTNIDFENLREEDKKMIQEGVKLYGEEELISFIEDFES